MNDTTVTISFLTILSIIHPYKETPVLSAGDSRKKSVNGNPDASHERDDHGLLQFVALRLPY